MLTYVHKHPGCRANEMATALSISLRSVQRHLGALKKKKTIEFRGAPKNGGYFLKQNASRESAKNTKK